MTGRTTETQSQESPRSVPTEFPCDELTGMAVSGGHGSKALVSKDTREDESVRWGAPVLRHQ